MAIEEYFSIIKALLDRYAVSTFVVTANVTFETRPAGQGFFAGIVEFADGSQLHLREYLDVVRETVEKVMYSYHFQGAGGELIFRYNNSAHRPALTSADHKHDSTGTSVSAPPKLEDVLNEIAEIKHWGQ